MEKFLIYVGSQMMDREFAFDLRDRDVEVLKVDRYRKAALEAILHDSLQSRFSKKDADLQPLFEEIADHTLHSSEAELKAFIEEMGKKLNVAFEIYIKQRL